MKLLLVFVKETDTWRDGPLYQALVQRLRQLEVAGATAQAGIMGFGRHHRVHHKGLFGISDDRPVTIAAVDDDAKIRSAARELRTMAPEALMIVAEAEEVEGRTS